MSRKSKSDTEQQLGLEQLRSFEEWNPAGIYRIGLDGRVLDCNPAFARMMGYDSRQEILAAGTLKAHYDPSERQKFLERLRDQSSIVNCEMRYRKRGGDYLWALESARISVTPAAVEGILVDITDQKRAEIRLEMQYELTRALSESTSLPGAAGGALKTIGEGLGWDMAAFWEIGGRGTALRCVDVWQSPSVANTRFESASRKTSLPSGSGLPGRVWQSRQPVWVADILQDGNFPRVAMAAEAGLHAAFAFPVLGGSSVLGVMEFFSRYVEQPDPSLIEMLAAFGSQIGQYMEQKRAHAALQENEARTRMIIETALDAVITMDADDTITGWNPEAERTFGWSREEALGRSVTETVVPPQYRADHKEGLRRFLQTGEGPLLGQRIEITGLHRDGHEFPVEMALLAAKVRDTWIFSSFFRDITERKRAEANLRESEERNRLIVRTALDAVVTMDAAGLITDWNPEAERIFGWPREEALGRKMSEMIVPMQHRDAHEGGLRRFLETGEGRVLNQRIEITALNRDGREFPVELSICQEKIQGAWQFSAFIRDITQRKRAEEALKRSHEELELRVQERTAQLVEAKDAADAANRAKSDFLANMSHEIRTPMNGIIGMTELALDTKLNSEQREMLETVKFCSDSLLVVVNDILDFSKIEARRLSLESIEFGLRECVEETANSLAVRAHEKGLELACRLAAEIPESLLGDPTRLRQILVNLVGNAIKFTSQGEVVVRAELESKTENRVTLRFSVSDTGLGIAREKQNLIFDPFTQADNSSTRRYGGTGLGLSISSALVSLMGGRIWVESELGAGSTFYFTVALERGSDAASQEPAPAACLCGLRVLVVDDNVTNRAILEETLKQWSAAPTLTGGADEAWAAIEKACDDGAPFSLMLIDAQMPGRDGFELIEQIRRKPELTGATIMMLSSAGQRGDAERCRELGVAAYLTKPVRQGELREAILKALGQTPSSLTPAPLITRHTRHGTRKVLSVLLVEDNAVNLALARRLLEKQGHGVVAAGNGSEALALFEKQRFDLVLMDVQMPEMDGLEATAALRQQEQGNGRHVPIIAMTAHAMKGDREKCLAAGMDGYVSKPLAAKDLFQAIQQAVPEDAR